MIFIHRKGSGERTVRNVLGHTHFLVRPTSFREAPQSRVLVDEYTLYSFYPNVLLIFLVDFLYE